MKFLTQADLSNQRIVNLGDPSAATDAANKQYVDNLVNGLSWKPAVRAATTANITLSGTQTVDGVALIAGDRVLVKDQSTASGNGIYVVAAGAWSRAADADSASELVNATAYVAEGTVNADKAFVQTANAPITVGTTSLTFAATGGGTSYSAGDGLQLAATTFSVLADPVSGGGISVSAAGVKVDTATVVRKYAATIGDGSTTAIVVTHNLGTQDITWSIRDASTNAGVLVDWVATTVNTATFTFATAPASSAYRVVIHG